MLPLNLQCLPGVYGAGGKLTKCFVGKLHRGPCTLNAIFPVPNGIGNSTK